MSEPEPEPEPRKGLWSKFKAFSIKAWRVWTESSASITALVAVIGLLFVVYQLHQANNSSRDINKTGQVQFSLQVMERLDTVLGTIAENNDCYNYVFKDSPPTSAPAGSMAELCGDSLLDVLSVVVKAESCLPDFSSNKHDWDSYIQYQFDKSPALGRRVVAKPWWPELNQFARAPGGGAHC